MLYHQLKLISCAFLKFANEAQYLGDNTFWNDKAKQILTENKGIDTRQITRFIRSVCDHLYARFPPDKQKCCSAFDPIALKNCAFLILVLQKFRNCAYNIKM